MRCWGGLSERAWTPCPSSAPRCIPTGGGPGGPPFAKKQLKQGGDRSRAPPRATLSTPSGPPALAGYLNKNFVGAGLLSSARPGRESLGNPQNGGRLQKLGCPPHPPRAPPQAHPARGGAGPGAPMGATAPPPGSLLPPCGVERKKNKNPEIRASSAARARQKPREMGGEEMSTGRRRRRRKAAAGWAASSRRLSPAGPQQVAAGLGDIPGDTERGEGGPGGAYLGREAWLRLPELFRRHRGDGRGGAAGRGGRRERSGEGRKARGKGEGGGEGEII